MSRMLSFVDHLSKLGRDVDHLIDTANYHAQRRQKSKALGSLRRAVETAGDNPDVVSRVANGLRELGELDEAGEVVRLAMFRHPRDRRFRQLWERHRFQQAWVGQQRN